MPNEDNPTVDDCLNFGDDNCRGDVKYRMPLSGSGMAHPRCEHHWAERLKTEDRLNRDYPDSPIPPAWFDPANAGEVWDEA